MRFEPYYLCNECKHNTKNYGRKLGVSYCFCESNGRMVPKEPVWDKRPLKDICGKFVKREEEAA